MEYSIDYSKTSSILWQNCREEPAADGYGAVLNFNGTNVTKLLNFKSNKKKDQVKSNRS